MTAALDTASSLLGEAQLLDPLVQLTGLRGYRSAEDVKAAAALFARHVQPDRIGPSGWVVDRKRGKYPLPLWVHKVGRMTPLLDRARLEQVEGLRYRIEVSPGSVALRRSDPVRLERTRERAERRAQARAAEEQARRDAGCHHDGCFAPGCSGCRALLTITADPDSTSRGKIRVWSRKSRRAMRERLATLDYTPLFVGPAGEHLVPAMVTLTYPGQWEDVAPSPQAVTRHFRALQLRWHREWGAPLVGVWKREFQRRGAPHFHILCVPPKDKPGLRFREWLGSTWADIVGADSCHDRGQVHRGSNCCECRRHIVAGTGIDYREGSRATDPRRLVTYFAKHGMFAAKDYQNEAPPTWESAGRFWGVLGLRPALGVAGIAPDVWQAVSRTLARHQRARRYVVTTQVMRGTDLYRLDRDTGELVQLRHRRRRNSTKVVQHFTGDYGGAGFAVANDGPALASMLHRVAALVETERPARWYGNRRGTSGLGPVGTLP